MVTPSVRLRDSRTISSELRPAQRIVRNASAMPLSSISLVGDAPALIRVGCDGPPFGTGIGLRLGHQGWSRIVRHRALRGPPLLTCAGIQPAPFAVRNDRGDAVTSFWCSTSVGHTWQQNSRSQQTPPMHHPSPLILFFGKTVQIVLQINRAIGRELVKRALRHRPVDFVKHLQNGLPRIVRRGFSGRRF